MFERVGHVLEQVQIQQNRYNMQCWVQCWVVGCLHLIDVVLQTHRYSSRKAEQMINARRQQMYFHLQNIKWQQCISLNHFTLNMQRILPGHTHIFPAKQNNNIWCMKGVLCSDVWKLI